MGWPLPKPDYDEEPTYLSEDARAIIEHIGQILAEEYVQLIKKYDPVNEGGEHKK